MKPQAAVPPEVLSTRCNPDDLPFRSTDEIPDLEGVLGQGRALGAMRFGLAARHDGYNVFAFGASGIGKHSAVIAMLERQAAQSTVPPDICYVSNFDTPNCPRLLQLPPGRGTALRHAMRQLLDELGGAIPAALESDEFKARLRQIDRGFEERQAQAVQALREKAESQQVKLYEQPGEFTFAPLYDGDVLDAAAFTRLPAETQRAIEDKVGALQAELADILERRVPEWQKERRAAIRRLRHEVTRVVVHQQLTGIRTQFTDLPTVLAYLDSVEQEIVQNAQEFLPRTHGGDDQQAAFRRYQVNVLVDHGATRGAPIVFEDNPTYTALIGRIEHIAQFGALVTDFNLIRPGALHRANGGYLVIEAHRLLSQPFAWEGLKRVLRARELRIESLGQAWSLISTVSLEPEPVPLNVKVILEGEPLLYYLLQAYDPEFPELFKVAADFDDQIDRSPDNVQSYARLIAALARKDGLRAFNRDAVAAVIDFSARLAADGHKLSTRMRDVLDLMQEADHFAGEAGRPLVEAGDVARAVDACIERLDRVRDRLHEEIRRGVLNIATDGRLVGQVNGLSVLDAGNFTFGLPARISATTRLGEGEVVDIEREVDMAGPVHSKGVFILSSFLGARYAQEFPLSLAASLTFEQSYSGVEGDSASLAELCALLSSLAALPLAQSLAVTGSVDQHGRVQAVGGVNEKIEGFFDVCAQRGPTGEQGVIIPQSNVQHLMLRQDVVEAVSAGRFRVYAVADVDTAMRLLGGIPAGRQRRDGSFPPKSVNGRVQQRLMQFAQLRQAYAAGPRDAPPPGT